MNVGEITISISLLFSPTPVTWSAPRLHLPPPKLPPRRAAPSSLPPPHSLPSSLPRHLRRADRSLRGGGIRREERWAAQRARRDSSSAAWRRPGARPPRRLGACGAPPQPFPPSIRRGGAIWPTQALAAACRGAHMGAGAAGRRSAGRGAKQAAGRREAAGRERRRGNDDP